MHDITLNKLQYYGSHLHLGVSLLLPVTCSKSQDLHELHRPPPLPFSGLTLQFAHNDMEVRPSHKRTSVETACSSTKRYSSKKSVSFQRDFSILCSLRTSLELLLAAVYLWVSVFAKAIMSMSMPRFLLAVVLVLCVLEGAVARQQALEPEVSWGALFIYFYFHIFTFIYLLIFATCTIVGAVGLSQHCCIASYVGSYVLGWQMSIEHLERECCCFSVVVTYEGAAGLTVRQF